MSKTKTRHPKIVPGSRFGKYVVVEKVQKSGAAKWRCMCDCGEEREVFHGNLNSGGSTSCGCDRFGSLPVEGDILGEFTLLSSHKSPKGITVWNARCSCGVIKNVNQYALINGSTKSCGCKAHSPEVVEKIRATFESKIVSKYEDLMVGKVFGRLKVIESVGRICAYGKKKDSVYGVKCLCECGNVVIRNKDLLLNGATSSCGCYRSEKGKTLVANTLEKLKITNANKVYKSSDDLRQRSLISSLRTEIMERDNFTCALCECKGKYLNVHHIEPWAKNSDLRFDPKNLITLCRDCHFEKAHNKFYAGPPCKKTSEILLEKISKIYSRGPHP